MHVAVADLEFLEGISALQNSSQTWSEDQKKKKVITSFLSHFLRTASLPFSTAPKQTH